MMIMLCGGFKVVGESGLFTPDDIAYVQAAGVKAVSFHKFPSKGCLVACASFNLMTENADL